METYHVTIVGLTWAGYTSAYGYTFDHLPTEFEIRQKAGDFQDVTDYEIESVAREFQVRKGGKVSVETTTRTLVRTFQHEDSPDVVLACAS